MNAKAKPKSKKKLSLDEARERAFGDRTGKMFSNHRRNAKAAGRWVDYDLFALRQLIRRAVTVGACPYCNGRLDEFNFSVDHRVPTSRGGGHVLSNLLVCCVSCNLSKGPLDHVEWRQLMQCLNAWAEPVKRHTLARLRAGGAQTRSAPAAAAAAPDPSPADAAAGTLDSYDEPDPEPEAAAGRPADPDHPDTPREGA